MILVVFEDIAMGRRMDIKGYGQCNHGKCGQTSSLQGVAIKEAGDTVDNDCNNDCDDSSKHVQIKMM